MIPGLPATARPAPLSVVIPVRDEARGLPPLLADLAVAPTLVAEVVVVDGGSRDASVAVAQLAGARVLSTAPGRGGQLALGIASSRSRWLLLLHGDGRLPPGWAASVSDAIGQGEEQAWAFRLAIAGADPSLRLVELSVTLRSR